MLTYEQALIETTSRLETAGSDTPKLDATLLLCEVVGKSKIQVYSHPRTQLNQEEYARFEAFVARREKAEPVAYILGRKGFWDIDLTISRDVLIPRPDTETLVETIFQTYPDKNQPLSVCELGVGSGAVIITLLMAYPKAKGVAVDISQPALACTRLNANQHGVLNRLEFVKSHWFEDLDKSCAFNVIASNPPYIPTKDMPDLMRDVRGYEPHEALDGGKDGLEAYRNIITAAPEFLKGGGLLALEVGQGQAADVRDLLNKTDRFTAPDIKQDMAGIERVVFARGRQ